MRRSRTRLVFLLAAAAAALVLLAPGTALAAGAAWDTGIGEQRDAQSVQGLATGQTVVTRGTYTYSSVGWVPTTPGLARAPGSANLPGFHTVGSAEALLPRVQRPWEVLGSDPAAGLNLPNADGTFYQQRHPVSLPAQAAAPEPVDWPAQPERQYGASARVSYRTARQEFAGPERLVDTRTRTWTEYADIRQQTRTEALDLGERRDGPRREGPWLVTDVYRTTATRPVTTYTWRERLVTETARVYETPYYYRVTVYRDVTVPGHWEKRLVPETRYWTRAVRETVQIPVTRTRQEPVYETVMVPYTYTYTEWVEERVPQYRLVAETRYRTVRKWYSFPWGGGFWYYERVPYTVTRYELVGHTTRLVPVTRTKTVMYPERRLAGWRTVTWTEYQTVTVERTVREPYTVMVERDVWVPERSWTEVASRYDTATPHRVSRRVEASVAHGPWAAKSFVEYGPLEARTAYDKLVQYVGWDVEPPAQGVKPPKVVPVITIADAEKYEWSNYSRYRREIQAKLLGLEGTALARAMRVLSDEELAKLYGFELVKPGR
ncbi:MAG: hypothetical protein AB1446_07760 [Bacillota bacterium]